MKKNILNPLALHVNLFIQANCNNAKEGQAFYIERYETFGYVKEEKLKILLKRYYPVIYIHKSLTIIK